MSIFDSFEWRQGASHWPSDDPKDSPIDTFVCKYCGEKFPIVMAGRQFIGEPSFIAQAEGLLRQHLKDHVDGIIDFQKKHLENSGEA